MKKKTVLQIILLSVVIVVTPVACQMFEEEELQPLPTRPVDSPPPPTSDTVPPTEPAPPPTQPPQKLPLGIGIPHMNAGEAVVISMIDMFSETRGWAIGGEEDPGNHILYTVDGGNTWADVTPPELNPSVGEPEKKAFGFFLDKTTAWVTYYLANGTIPDMPIIWYTTDGGTSWSGSPPLDTQVSMEHYSPIFLYFVNQNTGWFIVAVGAGMSHQYSVVYQTQNGGGSWEMIHDPMNSIYLQTCCKTGLSFADTQTGLITFEQGPYAEPYVEWTYDGGLTWEHETLQPLSNFPDMLTNGYCNGHSPHLFSSQIGMFALDCKNFKTYTTDYYIYKTHNGGTTWDGDEYPGGGLTCFDANNCFALSREIHKTTDGGATWEHVSTVYWDGQFSFVNPDLVWAVVRSDTGIALVKSTNGGELWEMLTAVIGEK